MTNKVRGSYSMDLKHQIRLRISTEMYDVLKRICNNKRNINLSRLIRYFVETGLEGLKKKKLVKPAQDHQDRKEIGA